VVGIAGAAVVALTALAWLRPWQSRPSSRELRVAAAADLQFALPEILDAFREEHPDIAVKVSFGASGNLSTQVQNGAPYDLFFSADRSFPARLIEQGLADGDTEFIYAVGRLVLWVPNDSRLDVEKRGIDVLLDPGVRKIAIANPRFAPYGLAAEKALRSLGVYDRVKDRLVLGENVGQAAHFVQSGAADAGLIPHSFAVAPTMRGKGRSWMVPADAYPRLEQAGVILTATRDRPAAEALRTFVQSPPGRAVLKRYGFTLREDRGGG
jgi:molybdate transport system substrate-binding protein